MLPVFKLFIFLTFLLFMGIAGYKAYHFLNNKIRGSSNGWELLGFSLMLVLANVVLFFGGLWVLVKVYGFLSNFNS